MALLSPTDRIRVGARKLVRTARRPLDMKAPNATPIASAHTEVIGRV